MNTDFIHVTSTDVLRFLPSQNNAYPTALAEIKAGRKCSHWIWYIFPQMRGFGHSARAIEYGIINFEEAKAYWAHPVLAARLREITEALLVHKGKNIEDILGAVDVMKVRSCMTLFNLIQPNDIFAEVLNQFYEGKPCAFTMAMCDEQTKARTMRGTILGAVVGDVIGSVYEGYPTKDYHFTMPLPTMRFTDDTVMTLAVADWIYSGNHSAEHLVEIMQGWGRRYRYAGYGGGFRNWLFTPNSQPYNSYGNGSAMRVSACGFAFDTLEQTIEMAERSAAVTHNHPEGIKGAVATAVAIFLARTGKTKEEIRTYIEEYYGYDLHRTCDDIRPHYHFEISCQETVPQSLVAFLDSTSYEDAIRLAISLGGDADTMGAITGAVAAAYYKEIPAALAEITLSKLPEDLKQVLMEFEEEYGK